MDQIVKIVNSRATHIEFKYSTPSKYVKAVKKELELKNIELE